MIEITPRAIDEVRKIMKSQGLTDAALRVGVKPSGCSGLEYVMDFTTEPQPEDQVLEFSGLKVLIDANSNAAIILEGLATPRPAIS